eukprot:scaffold3725_cov376-Prasinococcus_capsulatus_cf.AAC.1
MARPYSPCSDTPELPTTAHVWYRCRLALAGRHFKRSLGDTDACDTHHAAVTRRRRRRRRRRQRRPPQWPPHACTRRRRAARRASPRTASAPARPWRCARTRWPAAPAPRAPAAGP